MQVFNSGNYNTEEVRKTVIGLARDIRGIAFAFNTKVCFNDLYYLFTYMRYIVKQVNVSFLLQFYLDLYF